MKKKLAALMSALMLGSALSGCSGSSADETESNSEAPQSLADRAAFTYENTPDSDIMSVFAPDENGLLYVTNSSENDGTTVFFHVYGKDGSEEKTFPVSFEDIGGRTSDFIMLSGIDIKGDKMYIRLEDRILLYDLKTEALTTVCRLYNELSAITKIVLCDDGIYVLGEPKAAAEYSNESFTDENGVTHFFGGMPKVLLRVPYEGKMGDAEKIDIENPIAVTEKDGGVLVYAFDKEGGYYFSEISGGSENRKIYNNSFDTALSDIDLASEGLLMLSGYDTGKLCAGEIEPRGAVDIADNVYSFLPDDIKCTKDYIFYFTGDNSYDAVKKVRRLDADAALSKGRVNIINSEYMFGMPFSDGFEVNRTQLSEEMFAVKAISNDSSFDISWFSSDSSYAENMHSASAFYPLNDIPEVSEYLSNCLPYVKEACINEKGEIWALPVSLDIPVIAYNRKNCEQEGITFSENPKEFTAAVRSAYDNERRYECIRYSFVNGVINQYLINSDSFDTEEFRSLAETVKNECSMDVFKYDGMIYSNLMSYNFIKRLDPDGAVDKYTQAAYDEIFFTLIQSSHEQTQYLSDDENLLAAPLPKSVPGSLAAECTFICINPKGENLDNALIYAASVAKQLNTTENLILAGADENEGEYMKSLRDIYAEGRIYFAVPYEVYWSDFNDYCSGNISLDEFINGAEQKMKLYKGERAIGE